MSSDIKIEITKEDIDTYLKEVAKEYRKRAGKRVPAELILIGGASILVNYGFRNMTTDVDALIQASSSMKDAINTVGDRYGLINGWLNDDFKNTESYTPKIIEYSNYYRTFSNVLTIRTVSAEYLIAMKLRSKRGYKNDVSDVIGILMDHEKKGNPITLEQIQKAVTDLYGDWESLSSESQTFITKAISLGHFEQQYKQALQEEKQTKELLLQFEKEYPGVTTKENVDDITENLKKKLEQSRPSVKAQLQDIRKEQQSQHQYSHRKKDGPEI